MPRSLRRTSLYSRHLALGAKIVDFAGWQMPVEYPMGIRAEHLAVREACGIFDVSHMGQIETFGPRALELLQRLTSNDVAKIPVSGAQYGLLCREDGGVLDDLFTYRIAEDRYLTVSNASNHERDLDRFSVHCPLSGAEVMNRRDAYAMLAVQGPKARAIVSEIARLPLPRRMGCTTLELANVSVLVCGTGYTGEDGVELLCDSGDAPLLWDELTGRGAVPCGLGARDTLRLEACYHLYGNDLSVNRNPIEAGLGWCCVEGTEFIGSEQVAKMREEGPEQRLVAFTIEGGGIARAGNEVIGGGVVSSGTLSPSLGVGIGLAYVPSREASLGNRLEIDVRGRVRIAVVRGKPLYRKA